MVRGKNSVRCRFRRAFYNPVKGASSTKFLTVPRAQLNHARIEVQNGYAHSRITFKSAPEPLQSAIRLIEDELATRSGIAETAKVFVTGNRTPAIATFYRTTQMRPLPINEQLATPLITNCRELANAAITPWLAKKVDADDLHAKSQNSTHIIEAALAAEVLTRLGRPTVPTGISQKQVTPKQSPLMDRMFEDRIDVDAYEAYELVHPAYARQVLAVAETLPVFASKPDQTILDVGTGPGLPLQMLLELRPELYVVAINPSEIANVHLSRRFADDSRVQAVQASIIDYRPADYLFDAAVSIGASHHLDTKQFLSSIHECLAAEGVLVIADEMLAPFRDRRERNLALVTHHLWYILDTLFDLPASSSEAERAVCDILKQGLPLAMSLALSGRSEAATRQVRETFEAATDIDLGNALVAREAAFNRFHLLELQTLVVGLDYEVEQKTYPPSCRMHRYTMHEGTDEAFQCWFPYRTQRPAQNLQTGEHRPRCGMRRVRFPVSEFQDRCRSQSGCAACREGVSEQSSSQFWITFLKRLFMDGANPTMRAIPTLLPFIVFLPPWYVMAKRF
ncbi:Cro/CI family transcriptional regulator [Brucella sp. 191011898]|nr:Cro/CI family transcriptional regulator [Brucella sp. 191011898]